MNGIFSAGLMACLTLALSFFSIPSVVSAAEPAEVGWEGDRYFEYYRPKIVPRALTEAEHAEIDTLLAKHLTRSIPAKPTAKTFAALDNGALEMDGGDYAALQQLFALAESGDREALLAARKALLWGWGAGSPLNGTTLRWHVRGALLGHYTAQIWQRYGVEDGPGARLGMRLCLQDIPILYHSIPESYWARTRFVDCGFNLRYPISDRKAKERRKFEDSYSLAIVVGEWIEIPKKAPLQIDRFRQMIGSPEVEKARFDELVKRPNKVFFNKALRWTPGEYAWLLDYATRFGRMDEVRTEEFVLADRNAAQQKRMWEEHEKQMVVIRAEEARQGAFRDNIRRAKEAALRNAFTTPLPAAGNVTTRAYDQNGNYLGSERNSRTEAELKGAK